MESTEGLGKTQNDNDVAVFPLPSLVCALNQARLFQRRLGEEDDGKFKGGLGEY